MAFVDLISVDTHIDKLKFVRHARTIRRLDDEADAKTLAAFGQVILDFLGCRHAEAECHKNSPEAMALTVFIKPLK